MTWETMLAKRNRRLRRLSQPSSVERLVAKLRQAGYEVPDGYVFRRFYPGHWQRSAGAWVWSITKPGTGYEIGSPDSVKQLLKAKTFSDGPYNEIFGE